MGLLDFSKGAMLGMILLVPAIIAFIVDLKTEENAMVTISAVSFLANFKNMPIALMIPRFDS